MGFDSPNQHCKFEVPEIIFGRGLLNQVGACARRLGGKKVFLVSDEGLFRAGWVDRVIKSLLDAGLTFVLYDQITSNPKDHEIEDGYREYLKHGTDVIVGLGGGSAMDAAKGIAILGSNGGRLQDYRGTDRIHCPLPPLVLCPTTCGTGSDVSQFAVINDTAEQCKFTIMSRCIAPDISLTDPDTLETLPDEYVGSSAVDALSHAVEAYFSVAASSLTDVNAQEALILLNKSFVNAVQERRADDLENLSRASLHAGMAFSNALLGIGHALSHPIGGLYNANHGHVNAVLLPEVLRFDFPVVEKKLAGFAAALGHHSAGNGKAAEEMALETIDTLLDAGGGPRSLRKLGVREEDLPGLAERALKDVCVLTSPRQTDEEDLFGILKRAY
ncbi:MAG: iron-containing alcohol dehydrogenase [Deltaproteobacteria bacterium]|nr:iron-containing alcohol dehydrogenase [Deltaproteobacteria bacterium]